MVANGFKSLIKLQILFQHQFNFLLSIISGLKSCISENPKPFVSWRTVFRNTITYTIREKKIILKGKLTGYSQKWKPSKHEKLVAFLGLLATIMEVINISRPESLLEYQRLVLEAHHFFEPVFTEDRRLLMFHSSPYRKYYMGSIIHLYFWLLKSNRSML